jgi:hypothetical protein
MLGLLNVPVWIRKRAGLDSKTCLSGFEPALLLQSGHSRQYKQKKGDLTLRINALSMVNSLLGLGTPSEFN